MTCSWRRVFDGLAIALLLFVAACEVRGALTSATKYFPVILSIVCVLCCVGLYLGDPRIRTFAGCLLIILAVGLALTAWRHHVPDVVGVIMTAAFGVVGVGLIAAGIVRGAAGRESR